MGIDERAGKAPGLQGSGLGDANGVKVCLKDMGTRLGGKPRKDIGVRDGYHVPDGTGTEDPWA